MKYIPNIQEEILADEFTQIIEIDRENEKGRRYLGHPDILRTESGKIILMYPAGHGRGEIIIRESYDDGGSWTEVKKKPESFIYSQETPTLYSLKVDGKERILLVSGNPGWGKDFYGNETGFNTAYSDDDGETWTEFKTQHTHINGEKNFTVVAFASLVQIHENGKPVEKWMGIYHDQNFINYVTYLTFENGEEVWSEPRPIFTDYREIEKTYKICEIGLFRYEDRIYGFGRSESKRHLSTFFYSDDEGETWSEPKELPASLAGDRHKTLVHEGKLYSTFRRIILDIDEDGEVGEGDVKATDWVLWIGTIEDILEGRSGEKLITLKKDYTPFGIGGDTGYAGIDIKENRLLAVSYGHFDKDDCEYLSYIVGVKFNI